MHAALAVLCCASVWIGFNASVAGARGAEPAVNPDSSPASAIVSLADSLEAAGFYNDAVTEYVRALFIDPSHAARSEILSRIAFSSVRLGEWNRARVAIDEAVRSAPGDSSRESAELDRAVILIAAGSFDEARTALDRLARGSSREESRRRAAQLLVASSVLSADWSGALSSYRSYVKETDARDDSLETALEAASASRRLSPVTAAALSSVLPGSGQIYAGSWRSGIGAFLVSGGFGYLTAASFADGNYAAGVVEFLLLFRRYYVGNLRNAATAADEKNEATDARRREEILRILSRSAARAVAVPSQ